MQAPPPAPDGPPVEWESIDDFLGQLTAAMALGEMIHTPEFSLGDVMSAVEVMDPKMDGGFGLTRTPRPEELRDAGALCHNPNDRQACAIMDRLLQAEFTWFSGYALPQTVYTCVYAHLPLPLLGHPILAAYLKAVVKCCVVTCYAVTRADVREDEEFIPVVFAVPLAQDDALASAVEELESAVEALEQRVRGDAAAGEGEEGPRLAQAMLNRLRYRREYLRLLLVGTAEAASETDRIADLSALASQCRTHLRALQADRAPTTGVLGPEADVPDGAFSDHCVRWVTSPSPLAPVPFLTWDQTLAAAGKYMDELGALTEVAKCPTVAHILHFFAAFSERRPFVPARSFLWLLTYNSVEYRILNRDVLQNLVLQSLDVDYGAPFYARLAHDPLPPLEADGVPSPQHRSRELLYRWCDKSSSCIWLLLHALCSNRSRLRRKLANLFPELGAWQHHSWETDSALTPTDSTPELQEIYSKCFVLTAYTYEVVLWAMVTYLLLGCELELYKASELQGMYWYVDYLISLRFENFGNLHKTQDDPAPVRPRAGKGKKKPPVVYPALYTTRVKTRPAMQLHVVLEAHYCLARALFRFLAALPREGLLLEPASPAPLGSAAMVFNNRIKPFLYLVRPHYVRHETYLLHADTAAYSTGDLLTSASELLKRCRAVLESAAAAAAARGHPTNPALAPLLKVTKGNLVCMQLYQQGHAMGKDVEFDWSASPSFPIIKFRKKAEKGDRAAAPLLAA